MALGLTYSQAIPRMLENNANALVQNIRQIGQTVSGHLTEIQTRRDLQTMGQEIQGLNPQTEDFPAQLTQLAFRHPLALRDERGQMAVQLLGKAHNNWIDAKTATSRFPFSSFGTGGILNKETGVVVREPTDRPIPLAPNSRLVGPSGNVIVEPLPKPEGEYNLSPGQARFRGSEKIAENPKPEPVLTPYQRAQVEANQRKEVARAAAAQRKERKDALKLQLDQVNTQIKSFEKSYHDTFSREQKAGEGEVSKIATEREVIASTLQDFAKKRDEIVRELSIPEPVAEEESYPPAQGDDLPPVPDNALLPPTGSIRTIIKNGRKYEVNDATREVREIK